MSISGADNPLIAFFIIYGRKGEILFFCSVLDTTRNKILLLPFLLGTSEASSFSVALFSPSGLSVGTASSSSSSSITIHNSGFKVRNGATSLKKKKLNIKTVKLVRQQHIRLYKTIQFLQLIYNRELSP
jgi:hypothetical protein